MRGRTDQRSSDSPSVCALLGVASLNVTSSPRPGFRNPHTSPAALLVQGLAYQPARVRVAPRPPPLPPAASSSSAIGRGAGGVDAAACAGRGGGRGGSEAREARDFLQARPCCG